MVPGSFPGLQAWCMSMMMWNARREGNETDPSNV